MIQNKTIVVCDRCGVKTVMDYEPEREIFWHMVRSDGHELNKWVNVEKRHLCPTCAQEYQRLQVEHRKEVRRFLGIETLELEL